MPQAKRTRGPNKRKFVRNIRYIPVSVRLEGGRRIELSPRGTRGDSAPVSKEEIDDRLFDANLDLLFELVDEDQVKETRAKQTTNQRVHPALDQIRNPLGEKYEKGVVVQENFADQGVAVGKIDERGEIQRFKAPGSVDNPIPEIPAEVPPEEASDWLARNKNLEGPEAGLGGLKVVSEVQSDKRRK